MYIYHVAVEMAPFAKQGGLADVIHGLSKATLKLGAGVEVIIPRYQFLKLSLSKPFFIEANGFVISVAKGIVDGINVTFLECHKPGPLFNRNTPYGTHEEEIDSFLFFSMAALAYIAHEKNECIVHVHDWHTAIIATLLKHAHYPKIKAAILTIHNLEFQGRCTEGDLRKAGIKPVAGMRLEDPRDKSLVNLLSSGIIYADKITTVSKSYAEEILTPEYGWWLEGVLFENRHKLIGITNGIDQEHWNPMTDPCLHTNFSSTLHMADILEAKHHNKRALQKRCNLPLSHAPLLISVTRLTPQKSPYLILCAIEKAIELKMQYALVASGASSQEQKMFDRVKSIEGVHIEFGFNEELSRLSFGGADAIVIPSDFEPCGLTQLIAMRYGTIPIVRRTGGLKDTIEDIEYSAKAPTYRNGFTFNEKDKGSIDWVLNRVHDTITNHPAKWQELAIHCLKMDFSWDASAQEYLQIYKTMEAK